MLCNGEVSESTGSDRTDRTKVLCSEMSGLVLVSIKTRFFFWYTRKGKEKKTLFWRQEKKNGLMKIEEVVGAAKEEKEEVGGRGRG